jgi:glucose dehydrogenase
VRTIVRVAAMGILCAASAAHAHGQVTPERLVNSAKEPQNWLTYSGDYAGRRFSTLDQITTANVHSVIEVGLSDGSHRQVRNYPIGG